RRDRLAGGRTPCLAAHVGRTGGHRLRHRHLWAHRNDLFTFLRQPGLDATNWRAELAIRFGVILRKVWGGSRTWARAQSVLMSVWRTCWQQGRSALDTCSQLLRGQPVLLVQPPWARTTPVAFPLHRRFPTGS